MSNKYKHGDTVPNEALCTRLDELADAITKGRAAMGREFTMRVPAELDRDADLVLSESARRIKHQAQQIESLRAELKNAQDRIEALENKYYELIYEVEKKYPNETRHESALRLIKESQLVGDHSCKQSEGES